MLYETQKIIESIKADCTCKKIALLFKKIEDVNAMIRSNKQRPYDEFSKLFIIHTELHNYVRGLLKQISGVYNISI